MFDSHAHLNFEAFKDDYREVIKRSFENGIEGIINVGTNFKSSKRAVEIAEEFSKGPFLANKLAKVRNLGRVYAAVGFHPDHLDEIETGDIDSEIEKFRELAKNPKVVAIGEIGLDNYYFKTGRLKDTKENRKKTEEIFEKMLNLAGEVNLPIIIHSREAETETLKQLTDNPSTPLGVNSKQLTGGVVHCFTGSMEFAKKVLELGFYIGFTAIATYPNTDDLARVIKEVPLERILIETDCPFIAPQKYRGQRCEPWYVQETAQKIAEIKEVSLEEIVQKTTENAKKLFKL